VTSFSCFIALFGALYIRQTKNGFEFRKNQKQIKTIHTHGLNVKTGLKKRKNKKTILSYNLKL